MRLKPAWELHEAVWFWAQSLFKMVRACHGGAIFLFGWGCFKGGGGEVHPKRGDEGGGRFFYGDSKPPR